MKTEKRRIENRMISNSRIDNGKKVLSRSGNNNGKRMISNDGCKSEKKVIKSTGRNNGKRVISNTGSNNGKSCVSKNNSKKSLSRKAKIGFIKFALAAFVIAAAVCVILFSNHSVINADENGNAVQLTKYYKTITIDPGDTLWSIAEEYKSGAYHTTKDYVDELKSMNNLHSEVITSGQKLVVAYFAP